MHKKESKGQVAPVEGKFNHESVQDAAALAVYLEALAKGFKNGDMRFTRQDLDMHLKPKGLIGFSLEAKSKQGRMKLNLKFSWREADSEEPELDGPLQIEVPGEALK